MVIDPRILKTLTYYWRNEISRDCTFENNKYYLESSKHMNPKFTQREVHY